jgi:hypothetical protein
MRASRLLSSLVAVGAFGCATRPATQAAPAPDHAALSVELAPPQDLTIVFADGRSRRITEARTVLGQALHHDADSLVLAVSKVYSAEGGENFTAATLRLIPSPTDGVTVLSTRAGATNVLGTLALPALVALVVLLVAGLNSGAGT